MADTHALEPQIELRWPYNRSPLQNSDALVKVSSALRSQALYAEPFQISHADILSNLHAAQDDIASAIQLIGKRLGVKAP